MTPKLQCGLLSHFLVIFITEMHEETGIEYEQIWCKNIDERLVYHNHRIRQCTD